MPVEQGRELHGDVQRFRLDVGEDGFNAYLNNELFATSSSTSTLEKVIGVMLKRATGRDLVVLVIDAPKEKV